MFLTAFFHSVIGLILVIVHGKPFVENNAIFAVQPHDIGNQILGEVGFQLNEIGHDIICKLNFEGVVIIVPFTARNGRNYFVLPFPLLIFLLHFKNRLLV